MVPIDYVPDAFGPRSARRPRPCSQQPITDLNVASLVPPPPAYVHDQRDSGDNISLPSYHSSPLFSNIQTDDKRAPRDDAEAEAQPSRSSNNRSGNGLNAQQARPALPPAVVAAQNREITKRRAGALMGILFVVGFTIFLILLAISPKADEEGSNI